MGILRTRPSHEILSGESADVYFARAESILEREGLDPMVVMEVFSREAGILCGIDEAKNLLAHVLGEADPSEVTVEALDDGDTFSPKEVVLRIRARYRRFGLYETAILGMLAQSTGWATRRPGVRRGGGAPAGHLVRGPPRPPGHHRRPRLRGDRRRLRRRVDPGRGPPGRAQPDRDDAPLARPDLRRHRRGGDRVRSRPRPGRPADRPRRHVQGRGRGGAPGGPRARRPAVRDPARHAVRARPGDRRPGHRDPGPARPRGLPARQDRRLRRAQPGADPLLRGERAPRSTPTPSGSYISGAAPIDFTGDIKEIDGRPIAKRGRIPGRTESPRLRPVDLAGWRAGTVARRHVRAGPCDDLADGPGDRPGLRAGPRGIRATHRRARRSERESAYALLQRGQALMRRRHHAQAAIVLERAAGPSRARARSSRRSVGPSTTAASTSASRETFEALLEIDPSADYAHYALGQSLKHLRRPREARTHLRAGGRPQPAVDALPVGARPARGRRGLTARSTGPGGQVAGTTQCGHSTVASKPSWR